MIVLIQRSVTSPPPPRKATRLHIPLACAHTVYACAPLACSPILAAHCWSSGGIFVPLAVGHHPSKLLSPPTRVSHWIFSRARTAGVLLARWFVASKAVLEAHTRGRGMLRAARVRCGAVANSRRGGRRGSIDRIRIGDM